MKDPAFLFYSSDFLSGTMTMENSQVGVYIRLLCLQHQKGHLSEKDMRYICGTYDKDVYEKFVKDEQGLYYNKRLDDEVSRRISYSESRRTNRKGKKDMSIICQSYVEHMVTETETITNTITKDKDKGVKGEKITKKSVNDFFDSIWLLYPKKEGKASVSEKQKEILFKIGYDEMKRCVERYVKTKIGTESKYLKMGSTFFNSGYIDYLDKNQTAIEKSVIKREQNDGVFKI